MFRGRATEGDPAVLGQRHLLALQACHVVAGVGHHHRAIGAVVCKVEAAMALHQQEQAIYEELGNRAGLAKSYANQALILRTMFVLTVAAAEAAIGLAILVIYFRNRGSIAVEDIDLMRG